jgi:hypothetical protein
VNSPIDARDWVKLDGDATGPVSRCYDVLVRVLGEVEVEESRSTSLRPGRATGLARRPARRTDQPRPARHPAGHDQWRTPKPDRSARIFISAASSATAQTATRSSPTAEHRLAAKAATSSHRESPTSTSSTTPTDSPTTSHRAGHHRARQALELVRGKLHTARSGYVGLRRHAAARAEQVVATLGAELIDLRRPATPQASNR